jgi:hypothetical protein
LGEVTAKLLAAGGAEVRLTYNQGRADAQRIVEEIVSQGGAAGSLSLDVLSASQDSLSASMGGWTPTHLYYFATPFISPGRKGEFSTALFRQFCDYYITGFVNFLNSTRALEIRQVFHPSSVYVDEVPADLGEYAAAKMAAEVVCASLEKGVEGGLTIYRPRLPRMGTDQTVSLFPTDTEDAASVMLEHLRIFNGM